MNILLIGCGNIGFSLLSRWAQQAIFREIWVVQPSLSRAPDFANYPSIRFVDSLAAIPADFVEDVAVLAIKPQQLRAVEQDVANRQGLLLSCLAGIKIVVLSKAFMKHTIIRFMPNVAIKTGKSINLAVATSQSDEKSKVTFNTLIKPTGEIFWLDDEKQLDDLTPITGSGPAFFFLLAQCLYEETVKMGISQDTAREMIDNLFIGSASLIQLNESYEAIIQSVTSKKGVTEAALAILQPPFQPLLSQAIQAALERQKTLSK